jgi:signal transduction histidine kinase
MAMLKNAVTDRDIMMPNIEKQRILLLVFSLTISLFFPFLLAGPIMASIQTLRRGAQRLADEDLSTKAGGNIQGRDADLAVALNIMPEELENAFRRQRDMEQTRKNLIASLSHDLRTPLTSMRAMVEAITDDLVSDRATLERYFSNLNWEVEHISALIDDLLEISRLDTGTLELQLRPSSAGEILANVLDSMED